jgi:regulator of protease activity HflC (stomatin/prohibitin superfamily)
MNRAPRINGFRVVKYVIIPIVVLTVLLGCFSIVSTGNVGVKKTMGQTSIEESTAGLVPKLPFFTSVDEFNVREAVIDFQDLKPKAGDNLSLQDLDVSVFYEVNPSRAADLHIEFLGQTQYDENEGVYLPGYGIVFRQAREAIYDTVSTIDSLTIHQKRDQLTNAIKIRLQRSLDALSPGSFTVTQVALRAVTTDKSIEESIQLAVKAQKDLERTEIQLEIAEKEAEIAVTKATGEAEANRAVSASITPALLRQQYNEALMKFAETGANTVVMDGDANGLVNIK